MCDNKKFKKVVSVDKGNDDVKVYIGVKPEISNIVPEKRTVPKDDFLNYIDDALMVQK